MPLLDHFYPPVSNRSTWQGVHGGWPMVIVQKMLPLLPEGFVAEPRVNLGPYFEIDICGYESTESERYPSLLPESGGVATLAYVAPATTLETDVEISEEYAYEVLIFDETRERQLVAAVEIVSPANKDRPESRLAFVQKCLSLLREEVCVSIVDLVTVRQFNLYGQLLALLNREHPPFTTTEPSIYAATLRNQKLESGSHLKTWAYPLEVGKGLPTLPVWLSTDLSIPLELEASFEETCRTLRIIR